MNNMVHWKIIIVETSTQVFLLYNLFISYLITCSVQSHVSGNFLRTATGFLFFCSFSCLLLFVVMTAISKFTDRWPAGRRLNSSTKSHARKFYLNIAADELPQCPSLQELSFHTVMQLGVLQLLLKGMQANLPLDSLQPISLHTTGWREEFWRLRAFLRNIAQWPWPAFDCLENSPG